MNEFLIEENYQEYLKMVKAPEHLMHPVQKKEMRQAFFAAWGMCLIALKQSVADMPEDRAIEVLQDWCDQVKIFFDEDENG